ncbi:sialate O-acetylesterase, partial [bacterium]
MLKPDFRWLCLLLLAQPVNAEVILAPLFQAGGVLQREKPIPVWGKADPGKEVTVAFAGQTKKATTAPNGRWQVALDPLPASAEGRTLTVTEAGSAPKEIGDLLVGEVWLGSGQSNMEFVVAQTTPENQAIAAKGPVPLLRLFTVPKAISNTRLDTINSKWVNATPENASRFSA